MEYCLVFNINLLHYFGIWPSEDTRKPWKKAAYRMVSIFLLLQLILFYITELAGFYMNWGDIRKMTEAMCQITANTHLICKISYLLFNHKRFHKLLQSLNNISSHYPGIKNNNNLVFVKNCESVIKGFTFAYIGAGWLVGIFWVISPLIDNESGHSELPFHSWTPFNVSDPVLYSVMYTLHVMHASLFSTYIPSCSMFIFGLICHASARFKILHSLLLQSEISMESDKRMDKKEHEHKGLELYNYAFPEVEVKGNRKDTNNYKNLLNEELTTLQECIIYHQSILRFCKELEEILSPIMFMEIITTGIALCVVAFQVTEVPVYSLRFFTMATFLISVLFECGIFFWAGEQLITESLKTADIIYGCMQWYHNCSLFSRGIPIIIACSQSEVKLTCGKFYILSLSNYANVIKTSYSFYAVLKSLHDS
ncbi:Odorant receptor 69 [Blattella germanica]|nr:Odorant receptor 69 [Blattella germanica]